MIAHQRGEIDRLILRRERRRIPIRRRDESQFHLRDCNHISATVTSMKSFKSIGFLAALSATFFFCATLSLWGGASNPQAARTNCLFMLGPAIFVDVVPVHPAGLYILLAVATYVVHLSYWWFAVIVTWPPRLLTRILIIVTVHLGSVIPRWILHGFGQIP